MFAQTISYGDLNKTALYLRFKNICILPGIILNGLNMLSISDNSWGVDRDPRGNIDVDNLD